MRVSNNSESVVGYLLADIRYARTTSAGVEYFVSDRHGSTTHLVDASETIGLTYSYSDYGVMHEARAEGVLSNGFQYASELTMPSGMQTLGERFYDPKTMRFTTRDSAQMHNRYAYANANPITMVDPSGQNADEDVFFSRGWAAGVAAVVAIAATVYWWNAWGALSIPTIVSGVVAGFDAGVSISEAVHVFHPELGMFADVSPVTVGAVAFAVGIGDGILAIGNALPRG